MTAGAAGLARTLGELDLALSWLESALIAMFFGLLIVLGVVMLPIIALGIEGEATVVELTRLTLAWLMVIGAAHAAGRSAHPALGLASPAGLDGRSIAAAVVVPLASCLICLALMWAAWKLLVLDVSLGSSSHAGVPDWPVLAALPIGFGLMSARFALRALSGLVETVLARFRS
jgi:TRAP-type C4-dicarboxylate transport system permease small subunit